MFGPLLVGKCFYMTNFCLILNLYFDLLQTYCLCSAHLITLLLSYKILPHQQMQLEVSLCSVSSNLGNAHQYTAHIRSYPACRL